MKINHENILDLGESTVLLRPTYMKLNPRTNADIIARGDVIGEVDDFMFLDSFISTYYNI